MGFIFLYSLVQLSLIISYISAKQKEKKKSIQTEKIRPEDLPHVTVQLPIYNEKYVVERLIECVCQLEYPTDKLEIQILDDSTDETKHIIAGKVQEFQMQAIDIKHILRPNRTGYKAGALAYGTQMAKGEFIAIFDADFLPESDFLLKTIPWFKDDNIGVVQTKWEYTNEDYSYLTQIQAFGLNAHFTIEQVGRANGNHFINFNGTGGVWRKSCIVDAGGWNADTLTEDLDLSYRAQLKGWKFKYLENFGSPSELPVEINALKAQQFRWTKGAAACVRKHLLNVIRNKKINWSTKIQSGFHLMNSTVFVFVFLMSLLALPMILIKPNYPEFFILFRIATFFMISWFILAMFYWISYTYNKEKKWTVLFEFLWKFPLFLAVSMGMSLHNSLAVIEGYIGRKTPFVRTPKFNINHKTDKWENNAYSVKKVGTLTYFEGILLIYFIQSLIVAILYLEKGLIPLLALLVIGYGIVFFSSLIHKNRASRALVLKKA